MALVWPDVQIKIRNAPFLQLALLEDNFAQKMPFEIRMRNCTAKQSFDIILMMTGRRGFILLSAED